ncbi:hypothetical protein PILCRDRAFT_649108 [Piloderma croceum F 1598]|uniref:Ubiquitin-like domain-containing protein n=1 Tax=Piloderma croceum (strain F 1598) TaxID=765440 RepID=A0A0C3EV53_PILCF|nr:hypothetical protein PILCRDRAFT_649108 [Piloderma croceum F 1598]
MFSHARQIDLRGSNITSVGGDQHNLHAQNIIIIDGSISEQERFQLLRNLVHHGPRSTSTPGISSQRKAIPPSHPLETESVGNVATHFIDNIKQLLIDFNCGLKEELQTLRQTLILAGLAIQTYEHTPLGPNLANTINPEIVQCCTVLQKIFDSIDSCHRGLSSTPIHDLWRRVWWWWSMDRQASWRSELFSHRMLIGGCLMALNSVSWTEFGNRLHAGRFPLMDFLSYLRQGPSFLRYIQVHTVLVVDHLGQNIPVPTMFCSSWKDFDYIIKGYCLKDRFGDRYVMRAWRLQERFSK